MTPLYLLALSAWYGGMASQKVTLRCSEVLKGIILSGKSSTRDWMQDPRLHVAGSLAADHGEARPEVLWRLMFAVGHRLIDSGR